MPKTKFGVTLVGSNKLVVFGGLQCAEVLFLRKHMDDAHVLDTGMTNTATRHPPPATRHCQW
jgi:hypothetical protein